MDKVFWLYIHLSLSWIILSIWLIEQIVNDGIALSKSKKESQNKSRYCRGEIIMLSVIVAFIIATIYWLIGKILYKYVAASLVLVGVCVAIYTYMAIKQIFKIVFVSEKREFSSFDIGSFALSYIFWWFLLIIMSAAQPIVELINGLPAQYGDSVKALMAFLYYYFNIAFFLGGIYILLYYLRKVACYFEHKWSFTGKKIRGYIERLCGWWKKENKFSGLKSYRVWEKKEGPLWYRIFMTIPCLAFDICSTALAFIKMFTKAIIEGAIKGLVNTLRWLYRLMKRWWGKYENNEWMYVLAQTAGILSYFIVFVIIQYGDYEEVARNVYEFIGTIIIIPYFLTRITSAKENIN